MNLKVCNKCGAQFMDGKLFWRTGKEGKLEDLAGLVCDKYGDEQCINELKGTEHGGDTWEKWYKAIATTVVKSIKKEGDIYRWDASGRGGVGPIYTTAVYTTMLAMPYHYLPLYQR